MDTPIRMPLECPGCQTTLYPTIGSRPKPSAARPATFLYIIAGTIAAATYYVGLVLLRDWLKRPIGPVFGDENMVLYYVPPTWLLSLVALPVGLVPGLAIGWVAARLPEVRRLQCWNCGWSATFPARALWAEPSPQRSATAPSNAFDVIVDDTDPWTACTAWAYGEIREGRLPEDVEADLVAQGWPPDDVAGMVERCRREARGRRA